MKVNHEQTKNYIINITDLLKAQAHSADKLNADIEKLSNDSMLSQSYKNAQIEQLRTTYLENLRQAKEKIVEKLDNILLIEEENEKIVEFDVPEFSNTLAVINSAKGKLPSEVIEGIKLNFAGQYTALLAIKSAFENYDVNLKPYDFDEYTKNASVSINSLKIQAENIEQSKDSSLISLYRLFKDVLNFGVVRGISFSDTHREFPHYEKIKEDITRKAMGLKTE